MMPCVKQVGPLYFFDFLMGHLMKYNSSGFGIEELKLLQESDFENLFDLLNNELKKSCEQLGQEVKPIELLEKLKFKILVKDLKER